MRARELELSQGRFSSFKQWRIYCKYNNNIVHVSSTSQCASRVAEPHHDRLHTLLQPHQQHSMFRLTRHATDTHVETPQLVNDQLRNHEPRCLKHVLVLTSTGKLPAAVSPDSMTQSEPSSTALATSTFLHLSLTLRSCHCQPSSDQLITCTGKLPAAVSPDSMTQSEPSSTALATSVASALVGRGFFTIDSSI